jgi:type IV pilus assembly protein PilV
MNTYRHLVRYRGFTLLEVMIALVVLCIGLLGMAAMQVIGLRSNTTSSYLSQATIIASDMTERIRANQVAVAAGAFLNYDSAAVANCGVLPVPYCSEYSQDGTIIAGAACTPAQMAAFDLNVMACGNRINDGRIPNDGIASLPNGRMVVTCNDGVTCPAPYQHVVTVTWQDSARDATGKTVATTRTLVTPVIP